MNIFPEILSDENVKESHTGFSNALLNLSSKHINPENFETLTRIYKSTKQIHYRNKILKLLYDFPNPELQQFFEQAYKKERYLDMKTYALRGLAQFSDEKEIEKLISKLKPILAKREETTPYNYQEYELLRGKNALPFMVEKYGYECFKDLLKQVNEQYERMPDAFKGHITTDESGEIVCLRPASESSAMIRAFFDRQKI
ncbi:hypothetical protein P2W68_02200 [Chryseobacterium arthrosphaerae]|uniref:hypothetical protein n=1 Tax=Chryseobacterium arthrosphaerae TaxID=651561 RepID=UPI0023E0C0B0|nr:hypothetical protein [Chryseobacterium arthrosphaerae]WES98434.1 hypothetical protein P2W68_02200 [Chryseobacterium arthrosphaerae]